MSSAKLLPAIMLFVAFTGSVLAASCESSSGVTRAELIELYTSEGCSSCPPADKWMSELIPHVISASEIVPIAFHVDYWDRLGWRDRFATPAFTARQYAYSKVSGSSFVFTPQVIMAGHNEQNWSNNNHVREVVRAGGAIEPGAHIVLHQQALTSGKVKFDVKAQLLHAPILNEARIYAALFQNGLVSNVANGENSGKRLIHDYVVRNLITSQHADHHGLISLHDAFLLPEDALSELMGIAVFVQDAKTGKVLQAMSSPLCLKKQ